jgi:Zn ribbon nucleic-acid-binding protein
VRIHKVCPHCGTFDQMELQYDKRWEIVCLQCSNIIPIKPREVPKGLNKRQFEVAEIKSPFEVDTRLALPYGYNRTQRINVEE